MKTENKKSSQELEIQRRNREDQKWASRKTRWEAFKKSQKKS